MNNIRFFDAYQSLVILTCLRGSDLLNLGGYPNVFYWRIKIMELDLVDLSHLLKKRTVEIEEIIEGTGYKIKTVIGVGTFLLDNDGNLDLLTSKQQATFEKFLKPLLEKSLR